MRPRPEPANERPQVQVPQTRPASRIRTRSAAPLLCLLALIGSCVARAMAQAQMLSAIPPNLFGGGVVQPPNVVYPLQLIQPMVLVRGDPRPAAAAHSDARLPVVAPYEGYAFDPAEDISRSYVIDHKRFVEAFSTRCFVSTLLEDPFAVEPEFVIIRPKSEVRVNATAPIEHIRRSTRFDPRKQTLVLVHGFTQSYPNSTWLRKVRGLFELHGHLEHYNLVIMDWGAASHGHYAQVASKVGAMGSFLANFVLKLISLGADRAAIHIIGHSLGSHVAGFAGKRLRPRIGRITALDPAGPCFGKFISDSPANRLNADDAHQVDVFHYDDGFLGLTEPLGQFDVYVNGGSNQPGCNDNAVSMLQAILTIAFRRNRPLSESHTRSTEVASSQLSYTGCQEVAFECRDWAAFISGECGRCDHSNTQCFFIGFPFQYTTDQLDEPRALGPLRTSFPGKRLYIATSAKEPFCINHYQIVVKLERSPEIANMIRRNRWRVHLELFNDRNERLNLTLTNQMAPNAFSYLFLSEQAPARIVFGLLQVRSQSDDSIVPFNQPPSRRSSPSALHGGAPVAPPPPPPPLPPHERTDRLLRVNRIEVNFMSNFDPNIRRMLSSQLCPTHANIFPQQVVDSAKDQWIVFDECL